MFVSFFITVDNAKIIILSYIKQLFQKNHKLLQKEQAKRMIRTKKSNAHLAIGQPQNTQTNSIIAKEKKLLRKEIDNGTFVDGAIVKFDNNAITFG